MKKILFATTALVATASVAAADVTFSSYGRFGVISTSTDAVAAKAGKLDAAAIAVTAATDAVGDDANSTAIGEIEADILAKRVLVYAAAAGGMAAADSALATAEASLVAATGTDAVAKKTTTDITNRMEINVAASFEASNGITYGGKMRVRSDGGVAHFNAPQFSANSGALTIVLGNNSGQMYKAAIGEYDVGLTGLGFASYVLGGFDEYSSGGAGSQGVDVNYSSAGFSAGVSHSKTTKNTQVGVSYSVGAVSLGASMQDGKAAADDMSAISAGYSFDGGSVGVAYGENNGKKKTRLGGSFDVGAATTLSAYVVDENTAAVKNVYGVGVSHDLGGATLKAGYVDNKAGSVADFGITFNF